MKKPDLWFPGSNPVPFSLPPALDRHNYRMTIHKATNTRATRRKFSAFKGV